MDATDLEKHLAHFHEVEKPHKCEICSTAFATTNSLKQHIQAIH